jgi:hypothetical protein
MIYYDYDQAITGTLVPYMNMKSFIKVACSMNVEEVAVTEDNDGQTISIYEFFNFTA